MKLILEIYLLTLIPYCIVGQCDGFKASDFKGQLKQGIIVPSTGNQLLDDVFYQEQLKLEKFFLVNPDCNFLLEGRGKNAFAQVPHPGGYTYDQFDGAIFFGINLIKGELLNSEVHKHSLSYILAHEFAHIFQFTTKRYSSFRENPMKELQADFMAGYYMEKNYNLSSDDLYDLLDRIKGDPYVDSPDHHGTTKQRKSAFLAGTNSSDLSLNHAFEISEYFIENELFKNNPSRENYKQERSIMNDERVSSSDLKIYYKNMKEADQLYKLARKNETKGLLLVLGGLVVAGYGIYDLSQDDLNQSGLGPYALGFGAGIVITSGHEFSQARSYRNSARDYEAKAVNAITSTSIRFNNNMVSLNKTF